MSRLKIGWAVRDISTDGPIHIPGQFHMRISKGVIDPVTVTALVIDGGEDIAIFLSCDMEGMYGSLLDEVRAGVMQKDPSIPAEKILMNATHAHTGPAHCWDGTCDALPDELEIMDLDEYRHWLAGQASDAVVEAYQNRSEGGVAYGYGYAVVAHSRRVVYFDDVSKREGSITNSLTSVDGHARMYGETNDDMFTGYEAGTDHFMNVVFTFDKDDALTGAIINVPCPSQNSEGEYMLTGDFWHNVRENLRAKYGNINVLAQCAAAGDLAPRILHYQQAQNRRYKLKYGTVETKAENKIEYMNRLDIAERICKAFDEVYSWSKKEIYKDIPLCHVVKTVELSKRLISDEEYKYAVDSLAEQEKTPFKKTDNPLADLYTNSQITMGRARTRRVIERYKLQKTESKLPMEMHIIKLGDIAFASNQFELYMDYQHRIQARSPFEQTFIVQLCAQPDGRRSGTYLCTQRGFENKGYSASIYCNEVSVEGGQELVEETLKVLKEIK